MLHSGSMIDSRGHWNISGFCKLKFDFLDVYYGYNKSIIFQNRKAQRVACSSCIHLPHSGAVMLHRSAYADLSQQYRLFRTTDLYARNAVSSCQRDYDTPLLALCRYQKSSSADCADTDPRGNSVPRLSSAVSLTQRIRRIIRLAFGHQPSAIRRICVAYGLRI